MKFINLLILAFVILNSSHAVTLPDGVHSVPEPEKYLTGKLLVQYGEDNPKRLIHSATLISQDLIVTVFNEKIEEFIDNPKTSIFFLFMVPGKGLRIVPIKWCFRDSKKYCSRISKQNHLVFFKLESPLIDINFPVFDRSLPNTLINKEVTLVGFDWKQNNLALGDLKSDVRVVYEEFQKLYLAPIQCARMQLECCDVIAERMHALSVLDQLIEQSSNPTGAWADKLPKINKGDKVQLPYGNSRIEGRLKKQVEANCRGIGRGEFSHLAKLSPLLASSYNDSDYADKELFHRCLGPKLILPTPVDNQGTPEVNDAGCGVYYEDPIKGSVLAGIVMDIDRVDCQYLNINGCNQLRDAIIMPFSIIAEAFEYRCKPIHDRAFGLLELEKAVPKKKKRKGRKKKHSTTPRVPYDSKEEPEEPVAVEEEKETAKGMQDVPSLDAPIFKLADIGSSIEKETRNQKKNLLPTSTVFCDPKEELPGNTGKEVDAIGLKGNLLGPENLPSVSSKPEISEDYLYGTSWAAVVTKAAEGQVPYKEIYTFTLKKKSKRCILTVSSIRYRAIFGSHVWEGTWDIQENRKGQVLKMDFNIGTKQSFSFKPTMETGSLRLYETYLSKEKDRSPKQRDLILLQRLKHPGSGVLNEFSFDEVYESYTREFPKSIAIDSEIYKRVAVTPRVTADPIGLNGRWEVCGLISCLNGQVVPYTESYDLQLSDVGCVLNAQQGAWSVNFYYALDDIYQKNCNGCINIVLPSYERLTYGIYCSADGRILLSGSNLQLIDYRARKGPEVLYGLVLRKKD